MATQTATILVSDIVGSTDLRVALGEVRAEEIRRLHDRALTDVAERAGGTVIKGLGDGLLVLYPGASQAVSSAVAMHQTVHALARRESSTWPSGSVSHREMSRSRAVTASGCLSSRPPGCAQQRAPVRSSPRTW